MPDPGLDKAYALQTPQDNLDLYRDWAQTYDQSFAVEHGYVLPLRVAETFQSAGGTGPVLDLGAGTGLCAAALQQMGIGPLDATDLSQEMLDVAAQKGIYRRLFTGNMLERLPVDDGTYAGAVSSGTFTHGHVGPEALHEVVRLLRSGGLCAISVNAAHYEARGFAATLSAMGPAIQDLGQTEVAIYDESATGDHARDRALVVHFRKT